VIAGEIFGQDTSKVNSEFKYQLDVGFQFNQSYYFPVNLGFKGFLGRKWYYTTGFYYRYFDDQTPYGNNYDFTLLSYGGVGISNSFLKIFRGNLGAQLFGYFRKENGTREYSGLSYGYDDNTYGFAIGPEFTLEVVPVRLKECEFSIFFRLHFGYGIMYIEDIYPPNWSNNSYDKDVKYRDNVWFGGAPVGINIRF
jgi:hypothetical protein